MSILESLILGLVEGFTEFLPVSSTAHLILASHLLGLEQSEFVKTFEIAIQSGAILAVIALYRKKFFDIEILKKIAAAFIPTAAIGLAVYPFAKEQLFGNISVVLWALGIGGAVLIVFERFHPAKGAAEPVESAGGLAVGKDIKTLSYGRTALIGAFQALAIIPGVSRSAATIIGGRLLGLGREDVVEFSFLLAVPTILSATVLDLAKNAAEFSSADIPPLAVGFLVSFATAALGIKFLLSYVRKHSFMTFGVYRILLALLFLSILL